MKYRTSTGTISSQAATINFLGILSDQLIGLAMREYLDRRNAVQPDPLER
jgi:hypothetical protein